MPLFRVCSPDRGSTKLVSATSLQDLIEKSRRKLNVDSPGAAKIVLECDGAEVDEEEIFQELANSGNTLNTLLMLVIGESPEPELDNEPDQLLGQAEFPLEQYAFAGSQSSDFATFEIPWNQFPRNFILACHRQQVPDVSDRRKMIRVLADAMMTRNPRPPRHCIRQIAEELVRVYPHSLADQCGVGRKSDSMFFYLENRIANCNRGKCTLGGNYPQPPLHPSQFETAAEEECQVLPPAVAAADLVQQPDASSNGNGSGGDFSSFTIPWNRFPASFMESCQRKEVPDVSDRRKMIRVLADAMMAINRRPPRQVIRSVAENVVGCFPLSLADRSGVGNLYDTVFFCLDNRIAHCNRGRPVPTGNGAASYLAGGAGEGSSQQVKSSSSSSCSSSEFVGDALADLTTFQIPWHKFPLRFIESCQEEAIPEPADRREMIRVLADAVMALQPRPPRQCLRRIAERLVAVYPKSLEDVCGGRASKFESIFLCLDNRIAHVHRSRMAAAATAAAAATQHQRHQQQQQQVMPVEVKLENGNGFVGSSSASSIEDFSAFDIPWELFPARFLDACRRGERPELSDRQETVRILAAAMMRVNRRPPLHSIRQVARALVLAHPLSLADGDGDGSDTVCAYLENRIAHCNRRKFAPPPEAMLPEVEALLAKPELEDADSNTDDEPVLTGRQLDDDEDSESCESQEQKRLWLLEHFRDGDTRDYERIATYMDTTYEWQRRHVDGRGATPLEELREAWPFLFEESFLLQHATTLLGHKLKERFVEALRGGEAEAVLALCGGDGEIAAAVSPVVKTEQDDNVLALNLLETLATHFGDDVDSLFQLFEDDTPIQEMEEVVKVATPVMAIAGSSKLDANARIYVIIEGKECLRVTDFVSGFVTMFAAYHCFNLTFPESCCATLEFIKLEIIKITPNKGIEGGAKRKKTLVDSRVVQLSNMIIGSVPI